MSVRGRVIVVVGLVVAAGTFLAARPSDPPGPAPAALRANPDPVRAATRFLIELDLRTVLDAQRRREHVERWASRRDADSLQELYSMEAQRLQGLRRGLARAALVGYRTRTRTSTRASVEIWAVSLASIGQAPPTTSWRTVAVDLVLERSGWKVEGVRDVPGPALDLPPREFRGRARQFRRFHVVP